MPEDKNALDGKQSASAAQFNRQSDRYGQSHVLADTQDVEQGLRGVIVPSGGTALDVATGGGHTALWLARHGWQPDLNWYFDTTATSAENREKVLEAVAKASKHVRATLRLGNKDDKIVWWWPMLTLLSGKK